MANVATLLQTLMLFFTRMGPQRRFIPIMSAIDDSTRLWEAARATRLEQIIIPLFSLGKSRVIRENGNIVENTHGFTSVVSKYTPR
jgi:hypothetical protein